MDAVVACRVVPATVNVDKGSWRSGHCQAPVGLVERPARSLPLEIEDDIGERIAFQNVVLDFKRARLRLTLCRTHMNGILPRLPPGGEIRSPEREAYPVVDLSRRLQIANIDRFRGVGIHKL